MTAKSPLSANWSPPSANLVFEEGIWRAPANTRVSYPAEGNEECLQVEDDSYWFAHRLECIRAAMQAYPPPGMIYDIGGGNGFVAVGLAREGHSVALLEPGSGAVNAHRRGVPHVIQATLVDAALTPGAIEAASAFDVVEHIEDDLHFLVEIRRLLRSGGRFYCTVPSGPWLWSAEDRTAGHYRRYTATQLAAVLRRAGFTVEYQTHFFSWLPLPILLFRVLPSLLRPAGLAPAERRREMKSAHALPWFLRRPASRVHAWELSRIRRGATISVGTSLLGVARVP